MLMQGQLFTYLVAEQAVAVLLGGLLHFLWNVFNGFLQPNPLMPKGWLWMNYMSATTWVIYGLSAAQLGDEDGPIIVPGTRHFCSLCFTLPRRATITDTSPTSRVRPRCIVGCQTDSRDVSVGM